MFNSSLKAAAFYGGIRLSGAFAPVNILHIYQLLLVAYAAAGGTVTLLLLLEVILPLNKWYMCFFLTRG